MDNHLEQAVKQREEAKIQCYAKSEHFPGNSQDNVVDETGSSSDTIVSGVKHIFPL